MTSESKVVKSQYKSFGPRAIEGYGQGAALWVTVRFDDECGNGHNTFGVTGHVTVPRQRDWAACGMLHDEIAEVFPEFRPLLKWHLCSTNGPMHYIENARYWAGHYKQWCKGGPNDPPNLENLKGTIVYGALPEDATFDLAKMDDNDLVAFLANRLPRLMEAFRKDMEALGFTW